MRKHKQVVPSSECRPSAAHTRVNKRTLLLLLCVYKFIHSGGSFRKYTSTEIVYVVYVRTGGLNVQTNMRVGLDGASITASHFCPFAFQRVTVMYCMTKLALSFHFTGKFVQPQFDKSHFLVFSSDDFQDFSNRT